MIKRKTAIAMAASLLLAAGSAMAPAKAEELSDAERAIAAYVDAHFKEEISFLERVVNINSGTMNFEGVRAVGDVFGDEYEALGFKTRWLDMPEDVNRAGHLLAERSEGEGMKLLLIGHIDTVFPKTSSFQKFERIGEGDGMKAKGPGIDDMKDGDVAMLYALKALAETGNLDRGTIRVFLTGDEESVGLPQEYSRGPMIEAAQQSDLALNFESGRPGLAVMARRGSSGWTLKVKGKRAHSGGVFRASTGAGAIYEASRILNGFYSYVRGEQYLTLNPGTIMGGTSVEYDDMTSTGTTFGKINVVAQTAEVKGDLRFITEEQKESARDRMREIVAASLPQTEAEITFWDKYPAMPETEENRAFLARLSKVSEDLGYGPLEAIDPGRKGAADISFVAPHVAALDGLGGWGGGGHSLNEWVDLDSLKIATKRAAVFLYRLTHEQ